MPNTMKYALSQSLKKLLSSRKLDKITVKDITEDCGVNRQTFYYYFRDIYDLLEWNFQDATERLLRCGLDHRNWRSGVEAVKEYLQENQALVWNAYHSISHEAVSDFLKRTLRPYILFAVQEEARGLKQEPCQESVDFVTDIFTLTAAGIVMEWISAQRMEGAEGRLDELFTAMDGSVSLMLHNLENVKSRGIGKNDERAVQNNSVSIRNTNV